MSSVAFGHEGNYVIICAIFPSCPRPPFSSTLRVRAESRWLPLVFSQHCAWYLVGAQRNKWINKPRKAELESVSQVFYSKEEEFIALFPWMDKHKKEMGKTVLGSSCSFPVWSQTQVP